MAHAIYFENAVRNDEYNFLDRRSLLRFTILAQKEINAINEGHSDFFREYAAKNRHEFFAVAVESFFERPEEFRDHNPDLYNTLSLLLNQDTAEQKFQIRNIARRRFFSAVVYRPEWMG